MDQSTNADVSDKSASITGTVLKAASISPSSSATSKKVSSSRSSRYQKYRDSLKQVQTAGPAAFQQQAEEAAAEEAQKQKAAKEEAEKMRREEAADEEAHRQKDAEAKAEKTKQDESERENKAVAAEVQTQQHEERSTPVAAVVPVATQEEQRIGTGPSEAQVADTSAMDDNDDMSRAAGSVAVASNGENNLGSGNISSQPDPNSSAEISHGGPHEEPPVESKEEEPDFKARLSAHLLARPSPEDAAAIAEGSALRKSAKQEKGGDVEDQLTNYLHKGRLGAVAYASSAAQISQEDMDRLNSEAGKDQDRRRYIKPDRDSMTKEQVEFAEIAKEAADCAEEFLSRSRNDTKPSVVFSEDTKDKEQALKPASEHSEASSTGFGTMSYKEYMARRSARYCLCALIFIAIPLAIGLSIGLQSDSEPPPPSPTAQPLVSSPGAGRPSASPTPMLRPTSAPASVPTSIPVSTANPTPGLPTSPSPTIAPTGRFTAEQVIVLPRNLNSILDLLDALA